MRQLPSGTVTFLFTDIEGSTRLLDELGNGYRDVLERHRRVVREAVGHHGGVEVDTQGDAFFVAFARASDAVAAAEQAQQMLEIPVRMGIHTGEPTLSEAGYVGIDVHRGARICSAAHGRQVIVSEAAERLLDGVVLRDLGEHRLKDLGRPIRLYQLGDRDFPRLRTLYQTNLPVLPTPLIGREQELAEAQALLTREDVRLLTLTGPGGTGKTRLSLQLAAELVDSFADGVYAVALAPVRDPEFVLQTIAEALELREQPGVPVAETLTGYLRAKERLLLLDNFEQVLAAAPQLADLLARAPGLKLLVTSRAPLRLSGEREYPISPLPETDAVTLFAERAQGVKPSFALTDENEEAVRLICVRLDGLPLALELAAARIRMLPAPALLKRLEQRLPLLTGGARDLDERQQTLRGTISWSYDLLPLHEQALFRRLGVFVGGWTLEAAESVCGDGIDVFESLSALVDQSLVRQREHEDGELRFSMLETIREYAAGRLAQSGEDETIGVAHAGYFVAFADAAEPHLSGKEQMRWATLVERELANLRASHTWFVEHNGAEGSLRQAAALWAFWDRGRLTEGLELLRDGLRLRTAPPDAVRAKALARAGALAWIVGDLDDAAALLRDAEELARATGDDGERAFARSFLAFIAYLQGESEEAERLGESAIALARASDNYTALVQALTSVGAARSELDDFEGSVAMGEEALRVAREQGDERWIAISLTNLGEMALLGGDYLRAVALTGESEAIMRRLDEPRFLSGVLRLLGQASLHAGDCVRAASALRDAVSALTETRAKGDAFQVLPAVGALAAEVGMNCEAATLFAAVEALGESMGAESLAAMNVLDPWIERAEQAMEPAALELARQEGRFLDFDETLEYALATAERACELATIPNA